MSTNVVTGFIFFFIYLIAQVTICRDLVLFGVGFCFPYIAFILFMSAGVGTFFLVILGFVLGLSVDIFYDSLGVHASASVFIAFVRNSWLSVIAPQGGYSKGSGGIMFLSNSPWWLLLYIYPLIFLHHTIIFFVEIGGFMLFGYTLLKIAVSSLFTLAILFLLRYLFPRRKRI